MVRSSKAAPAAKEPDYDKVTNVKDLFDEVGKYIEKKVHDGALNRGTSELHGFLTSVTYPGDARSSKSTPKDPCILEYDKHTNVTSTVIDPCKHKSGKRFSDTEGAHCSRKGIKGNNTGPGGACAPFRRLHLCDQHLSHMQDNKIINTHNLLLEVSLAAKYEGESLKKYHAQYQAENTDFKTNICTELARSFADIGDIVRGRDLYLGNSQEREQKEKLEKNLKEIFKKIYGSLKGREAKTQYNDPEGNFYQLREDWWALNRKDVWKALTCDAPAGAQYFRLTCSDGNSSAHNRCTCVDGDPPTFFDYVPQYLRWFEEWAEDFCRIKRRKLQKLEKECRGMGDGDKKRYCSRNAHDCEKTVRARGELVMGNGCIKCFYGCPSYETWIDNQKQEFLKQLNKYEKEMQTYTNGAVVSGRKKRAASTTKYEGYEKRFHEELKTSEYGNVNSFLGLLNKEKECTNIKDGKEGKIDFREDHNKNNNIDKDKRTFYRSEYCEPCPDCGVTCDNNECKEKEKNNCPSIYEIYKPKQNGKTTEIKILESGDKQKEIENKLNEFCVDSNKSSLYEEWKCYLPEELTNNGEELQDGDDVKTGGGLCISENKKSENISQNEPEKTQKTFNNFFYYWVAHMLKDSIHWRTRKLRKCLKNNKKCEKDKCSGDCGCFEKWVAQKNEEWMPIKNHFYAQTGFGETTHDALPHYWILENILEQEFLKDDSAENAEGRSEEKSQTRDDEDAQEIKRIKELVQKMEEEREKNHSMQETIIDLLFKEEKDDANRCKENNPEKCEEPRDPHPARSEDFEEPTRNDVVHDESEDEEDEDPEGDLEEENDNNDEDAVETEASEESITEKTVTPQEDKLKVCSIVDGILKDTPSLQEACKQKYQYGKERFTQWYCGGGKSGEKGAICIPPRRRKMYVTPLKTWAENYNKGKSQDGVVSGEGSVKTGDQGAKGEKGDKGPNGDAGSNIVSDGSESSVSSGEQGKVGPSGEAGINGGAEGSSRGPGGEGKGDQGVEGTVGEKNGQEAGSSGSSSEAVSGSSDGETTGVSRDSEAQTSPQPSVKNPSPQPSVKNPEEELLKAFVESAAVETFFLWDRYKKIKEKEEEERKQRRDREENGLGGLSLSPELQPRLIPGGVNEMAEPGAGLPLGPQDLSVDLSAIQAVQVKDGKSNLIFDNLINSNSGARSSGSALPKLGEAPSLDSVDPNHPDNLSRGVIPPPFLRQMFYTIADYRDILVHGGGTGDSDNKEGDGSSNDNIVLEASGNTEEERNKMKEIQEKITTALKEGDKSKQVKPGQSSVTTPSSWWEKNGPHIWKGMICALTYEDSGAIGSTSLEQDPDLKTNLYENNTKTGGKYHYETVTLEDESSEIQAKPTGGDTPTINNPKLKDFVVRPTFFRYLEEWGENFCKKRKEMLEIIEKECTEDGEGKIQKCSGDGEDCEDQLEQEPTTLPDLNCPGCGRECRKYRKWIRRKKDEFTQQSNAYTGQKTKCEKENKGGANGFCGTLQTNYTEAAKFLEKLGSCKNNDNESGKVNKIFDKNGDTFKDAENCKPCSQFKIKCNGNGDCIGDGTKVKCNGKTKTVITANHIGNGGDSTVLDIRVSDNGEKGFDDLNDCQKTDIFKGIRKDEWKCGKVCGYVVCKPEKGNGEKASGGKNDQIITIRGLVTHWVQMFLEDYNRIKHKISHCTKNGDGSKCENKCKDKCDCVGKWVQAKKKEWERIRKRFLEQYKHTDQDGYNVRSFLETFIPQITDVTEKDKVIKLSVFDKSCGCSADANSPKKNGNKDAVECLLDRLETKAKTCAENPQTACQTLPPSGENSTPLVGDDDSLEEENPVTQPNICPTTQQDEEKEEGGCDAAKPPSSVSDDSGTENKEKEQEPSAPLPTESSTPTEGNPEQTPILKPEEEAPQPENAKPPSTPAAPRPSPPRPQKPPPPYLSPPLKTAMASSTLAWSVGIGFVALSYWFLKKKTKSSVDMLRVLQIPQNDYDIPTFKSKNRYIPYKSAQYRGKRYIYLEGDSGTDSGYTDHYSDITSSSESEYEEFDINDIYVTGSPKYKTLIEVVLEPSGKNTSTSDNTISNSDNTIPTSDKPNTPTSDIPNKTSDTPNTLSDTPNTPSDTPPPITDEVWNTLKDEFIFNMLQNTQPNDVPNDYTSGTTPTNTNNTTPSRHNVDNNTHPTPSRHNVDNNTNNTTTSHDNVDNNNHPTPSRHTLDQKPFIMSIHDRNLLNGEEYSYDMENSGNNDLYSGQNNLYGDIDTINGNNDLYSGKNDPTSGSNDVYSGENDPISSKNNTYSGIDLINDSLNSGNQPIDIYDEILKRKENELFGTNHVKHTTSTHSVAKPTNSDPIHNQLELFHKWLDRHRDMCEKLGNKVDILNQLKEKWENDTSTSGNKHSDNIPSNIPSSDIHPSDIHSGKLSDIRSGKLSDIPSGNKTLNTDVSIQIDMNNPKTTNEFSNMDSNPNRVDDNINLDTYPDKYTVGNINPNLVGNINTNLVGNQNPNLTIPSNPNLVETPTNPNPNHVQIQMSVKNTQIVEENFPIGDVWGI
ncbi:erythrocyte membrane protein 1, EMP1 [Plasmodium reichenowi]|uniref:Erythrocyte membrane protein 1, EMP1 n=1 Tax=Plasmodium reichenowi TaxID=5854 RepID=A0A060RQP3_PLARE|nr:erythrocyte membrane protein 1, EMP1 [Plasmodium reichenowi]